MDTRKWKIKVVDHCIQVSKYVRVNQTILNKRNEEAAKKTNNYYKEKEMEKAKKAASRRKKV